MGMEAGNPSSRSRWSRRAWQVAVLLAALLVAVPAGAPAQSDGPVPMGIIVQPEPHDLQVRIETDASRYDVGDRAEVDFWVNRDAYVYIYNLSASGQVSLIFPNRYDKENLVRAGTHRLPGRGYSLVLRGPEGAEYLQIIATAAPIGFYDADALEREAFPNLGAPGGVESRVRAQLEIVPGRQWAVDWTSYRVGRQVSLPLPPPPPPSWDRRGWLRVESTPSNSYVYVDGTYEGQTPLSLRLDEGRYRVEVRRNGYETETEWVRVRTGEETRVRLDLDREDRWGPPSPPAPPPPPPSMPPTSTPSRPPTPPPSEPITREYTPYFRTGFDLGMGPDPDEPGREVFSFGGDFGGPFFGLGFSVRNTGERLWDYDRVDSPDGILDPITVEEGPESEVYGRFTILRSGALVIRTGVGLAWQKKTTVRKDDYLKPPDQGVGMEPTGPGYSETHVYPTALIGAGVEHGFGYFWAGYHIRRGAVVGAGFRF